MTLTGMRKHVGIPEEAGLVTTGEGSAGPSPLPEAGRRRLDEVAA